MAIMDQKQMERAIELFGSALSHGVRPGPSKTIYRQELRVGGQTVEVVETFEIAVKEAADVAE